MTRMLREVFTLETFVKPLRGAATVSGAFFAPFIAQITDAKLWWALLLVVTIMGDWIAGTAASKKDDTYASEYGIAGIARTLFIFMLPILGLCADLAFSSLTTIDNPGVVYYALTTGLIYHSWESMTANTIRAGWERWVPLWAMRWVASELKAKVTRAERRAKELQSSSDKDE